MSTSHEAEPDPHFHTPLLKVGPRQCRYIVSDSTRAAVCCGAPTSETSSWCGWHERVVFMPRLPERERQAAVSHARAAYLRAGRQLPRAA